ncbi:hypothetical protein AAE478_004893 [Parahypoxylon ruwenzoriense]
MRPLVLAALPTRAFGYGGSSSRNAVTAASSSLRSWATRRTFTSLPSLRPTILPSSSSATVFRPSSLPTFAHAPSPASGAATVPDLVPKTCITGHPALGSCAAQIRCGPRPTMARTSRLIRKRRHGFLSRIRTRNGRRTLQRRKDKKRSVLSS